MKSARLSPENAPILFFSTLIRHKQVGNQPDCKPCIRRARTDAHTVFVNGREVVRDRKLVNLNRHQGFMVRRARPRAREIVEKAGLHLRANSPWLKSRTEAHNETLMCGESGRVSPNSAQRTSALTHRHSRLD